MIKFIFIVILILTIGYLISGPLSSLLVLFNSNSSSFFGLLTQSFNIINNFLTSMFTYNYISTIFMYFLVCALFFYILNKLFRS